MPAVNKMSVVPETVQRDAVAEVKTTVSPEVAVALKVTVPVPRVLFESDENAISCAAALTVMVKEFVVAVAVLLSVTRTVIELVPEVVGTPEMIPVEESKERPVESDPEAIENELPPLPPDVESDSV